MTDPTPRLEDLTRQQLKALAAELTERLQTEEFLQGETAAANRIYSAELRAEQQSHAETKRELAVAVEALGDISEGREPQCLVARLGERTAECDINAPCVACRAGAARRAVRTELESSRAALQEERELHARHNSERLHYREKYFEEQRRREAAERDAVALALHGCGPGCSHEGCNIKNDVAYWEAYERQVGNHPAPSSPPGTSAFKLPDLFCKVTGNPSGTDTWAVGHTCECESCTEYVRRMAQGTSVDRWPPRTIPDQQLVEIEGSGT